MSSSGTACEAYWRIMNTPNAGMPTPFFMKCLIAPAPSRMGDRLIETSFKAPFLARRWVW